MCEVGKRARSTCSDQRFKHHAYCGPKLEVNSIGIETDWDHDGTRDVIAEVRRLLVISPALEEVTLGGRFTDFQTEGPPLLVDVSAFTKLPCLRKLDI